MQTIRTESDLDDAFGVARTAAVTVAWASTGLFDELAEGRPMRLEELTGDARALKVTARILLHAGLLVRHGDRYALSPSAQTLYDDQVLSTYRALDYFEELSRLDELLEEGGPLRDDDGNGGSEIGAHPDDVEQTRKFQKMLYRRSATSARATADWIDRMVDGDARVLDLGGGHGRYGMELVKRDHRVTLFDLPVSIESAKSMHGDELEYIEGDFFTDDLGGPYDVVLASNIVHGLDEEDNLKLTRRIAEALAPGGMYVVKDMFFDDLGAWPPRAVLFGLTMLMYTDGGDTYSMETMQRWFEEAGLVAERPVIFESFVLAIGARR